MKFEIIRTSDKYSFNDESPCEEAIGEIINIIDGNIKIRYIVEINTLNELVELYKNNGRLMIHDSEYKNIDLCIEICDEYSE